MGRSLMPTGLGRFLALAIVLATAGCASIEGPAGVGPPGIRPSNLKLLSAAPVKGDAAIFAFRPITGAPAEMVFTLEDLIVEQAAIRRVNIVERGDPRATYEVQGYISAVGDPHSTLMVYVWDVYDLSGRHIHRFTGQEVASGSSADPWSGVSKQIMADAARETIDSMADWIRE